MSYPRLLRLDSKVEESLKSYLDAELSNHYAERGAFLDDLINAQKDYWAKPETKQRTFPFTGAANIIIPLTAIAFEAIHARSMTTLFGLKQMVAAKAITPEMSDLAPKFESFIEHELKQSKFKANLEPSIIEIEKFGTGVGKSSYCKVVKYGMRTIGTQEEEFPVVVKQGATADAVPLSRFMMPFTAKDPQSSPWVGEELTMTPTEIQLHEESGLFVKGIHAKLNQYYYQIGSTSINSGQKFEDTQAALENRTAYLPQRLTFAELWLGYDVGDNGRMREIVVHYHRESRTLLSVRYNYYSDLRRPYRTGVYFPVEHRWTGIGICKQNEQFQAEITTQHRQRLDNATLANMRMIKVSKLSGYGPKEPVFPGKMWFLDDMTHVEAIQMGEIYPSAYNNEQQSLLYSQQRSGVNEVTLGMPQAGTPGTATGDLQRVQEGRRKFDYTFGNIKTFVNEILMDFACNIQQFGPRNVSWFDNADGQQAKMVLDMPAEQLRDGMLIELRLAGEQENKIIDRQNWTQIAGMLQQYYSSLIQLAMGTGDQQLAMAISKKAMQAASEAMKQVVESYDLKNIDRIVMMELITNGSNQLPIVGGSGGVGDGNANVPMAAAPQATAIPDAAYRSGLAGILKPA
jgi:hypothetical protein